MALNNQAEPVSEDNSDNVFQIICLHKEADQPSNLNKIFESYGTNTLEHKVPVVDSSVTDRLLETSDEQQDYATMALKTISAQDAMQGRLAKTKNRELKLVEINGETVLAAGKVRERSPVSKQELDNDMDRYMQEAALLRANKSGRTTPDLSACNAFNQSNSMRTKVELKQEPMDYVSSVVRVPFKPKQNIKREKDKDKDLPTQEEMDSDIERYMMEGRRKRNQKNDLREQVDRVRSMEQMDELVDQEMIKRMNQHELMDDQAF